MILARRFRGPPDSANGGYACGAVAGLLGGSDVESTLRVPPPLDRELATDIRDGRAIVRDGDVIVAEAVAAAVDLEVPAPVSFDEAERASMRFPWLTTHPFPMCFGCGPERTPEDGLRILPGAVDGRTIAAAPWIPHGSTGDRDGRVQLPIVWSALDCPSWYGMHCFHPWAEGGVLLGRLAARILARPRVGERHVAIGWFVGRDGRKMTMGSALHTADGELLAFAKALWIAFK